jgi:maltooligosyltrehalose trehalohydrolase
VIDPLTYQWHDSAWCGRAWEEAVIYETHVGAFTPEGTFAGIETKFDHLCSLGVTAIELMPIAEFPGRWDWGYDGVLPFAPDSSYGTPDDLKHLIDTAHSRGVMVFLDVVYNHFGPDGDYEHAIAPEMFTPQYKTPWGEAIRFQGRNIKPVREFFIQNALYWVEEFHVDGFRLDAVHAIHDESPRHVLEELADRVRSACRGRDIHLILENEENHAGRLSRDADGMPRWFTAQWNDDVHHALHCAVTKETSGYYHDYCGDWAMLGRTLAQGFAFQGEVMPFRGRPRGEPSGDLPPAAFVAFIQNHDQVGNRAFGERLTEISPSEAVRAIAAIYLLLPQIPMLFMGEEWAASQPFPFFCDFKDELATAVRNGRREEFARFPEFQDPAKRETIPDPVSEQTFASAKLHWDDIAVEPHAGWLDWYRRILAVRQRDIVPCVRGMSCGGEFTIIAPGAVMVTWACSDGSHVLLEANLSNSDVVFPDSGEAQIIWQEGDVVAGGAAGPHSVRWSVARRTS